MMSKYVVDLQQIDRSKIMLAGGKGANLGELFCIDGINVPAGFCITTDAFEYLVQNAAGLDSLLDELASLRAQDRQKISTVCAGIRSFIEKIPDPQPAVDEIATHLAKYGENEAFAVRSSATAEDLPSASFAGQQDTYLNVIGRDAILSHIRKCQASLFTDRAVIYRIQNGFDNRKVRLAVIVQQMVFPQAAGILFTADPVNGNRTVSSIDAGFGLGEAMVSGLVNTDSYKIQGGSIRKQIPAKKLAIYAVKGGGTKEQEIETGQQKMQVLTDDQILRLECTGRRIEKYFGRPQDIEWCLAGDVFYIVQSRPITALFPIPEVNDKENHVYLSVGHQQMMTDAMKPLGLSLWQLTAFRPMFKAGGRLFVDVTQQLSSPVSKKMLIKVMGEHDPLMKDALVTITGRQDFIKSSPDDTNEHNPVKSSAGKSFGEIMAHLESIGASDSIAAVSDLIRRTELSVIALKENIDTKSGPDLFDFILADNQQLRQSLFDPKNIGVITAAIDASAWINENMEAWLGEKNAADALSQSAPNNVTSKMGLALLDVADMIRLYPDVISFLQQANDDSFLEEMVKLNGGIETREAINAYLDKYGMRCAGEIDITRARWSENPAALIPAILSNIRSLQANSGSMKFEQGLQAATKKEEELLARLRHLPDGPQKVMKTKQMISLLRNLIGYREYPKYGIVSRLFVCKQALLKEAELLVQSGVIRQKEDVFYLTFEEFRETVRTYDLDYRLIVERREEHKTFERLSPPRVITSEGEIITSGYNREGLQAGAIAGLAVSSGIVEGRARVILTMNDADLEDGDILVTAFTDPSWTPLFLAVKGLVTEVGGLMTHGAVIAREYGLPAVVGVENATKLINDGQRIRVNGTDGYVEIL